mmetsp:Transcript_12156/g.30794  ORF Transcript_12156/g.30794 Transcript_12156/m.30794 type:complete len:116 (-) Transcript_12156:1229-1576(-)
MALKGEGDPRWIVEEREDGKNLNAWHWEERNLLPWIKSRLPHFLVSECHRGADEKDVLSIVKVQFGWPTYCLVCVCVCVWLLAFVVCFYVSHLFSWFCDNFLSWFRCSSRSRLEL